MSSIELIRENKIDSVFRLHIAYVSNVRWVICMEVAQWRRNGGVRQERLSKKNFVEAWCKVSRHCHQARQWV